MAEEKELFEKQRLGVNAPAIGARFVATSALTALGVGGSVLLGLAPLTAGTSLVAMVGTGVGYGLASFGALSSLGIALPRYINFKKYKKNLEFSLGDVNNYIENGITFDKELQITTKMIEEVTLSSGLSNAGEELESRLKIATDTRKELQDNEFYKSNNSTSKNMSLAKRIKNNEKVSWVEDRIKKVIVDRIDRLAELSMMKKYDWPEIKNGKKSGRRLSDEAIKSREMEMNTIQHFLYEVLNKSGDQEPYLNVIKSRLKKHKDVIELVTNFEYIVPPAELALPHAPDRRTEINRLIRANRVNEAMKEAYLNVPNSLASATSASTDRRSRDIARGKLADSQYYADRTKANYDRSKIIAREFEQFVHDTEVKFQDIYEDAEADIATKLSRVFDETDRLIQQARNKTDEVKTIHTEASNALKEILKAERNADAKLARANEKLDEIITDALLAKQASRDAKGYANTAKQNANQTANEKARAKKARIEAQGHSNTAKQNAEQANIYKRNTKEAQIEAETSASWANHAEMEARTSANLAKKAQEDAIDSAGLAEEYASTAELYSDKAKQSAREAKDATEHIEDMASAIELASSFIEKLVGEMKAKYTDINNMVTTVNQNVKRFEDLVNSGKLEEAEALSDKVSGIYTDLVKELSSMTASIAKEVNSQVRKRLERQGLNKEDFEDEISSTVKAEVKKQLRTITIETNRVKRQLAEAQAELAKKKELTKKAPEQRDAINALTGYVVQLYEELNSGAEVLPTTVDRQAGKNAKSKVTSRVRETGGDKVSTNKQSQAFKMTLGLCKDNLSGTSRERAIELYNKGLSTLTTAECEELIKLIQKACKLYNFSQTSPLTND